MVASSQSFPAVSQEQFYVSISRARERARIYTDDAELLGRRVEDSHTRKAAIELEGLREALRRAGYTRAPEREEQQEARTERATVTQRATVRAEQTIRRVVRQLRELRAERLAPVERMVRSARQWIGQRLGMEQTQRQTAREFIAQAQREAQRQSQSRGIRM